MKSLLIALVIPFLGFSQYPDGVYKYAKITVVGGGINSIDSMTEADPTVDIDVKNITNSDINRWNDAVNLLNTGYPNYTLLDYLINHVWIPQNTDALAEGTTNLYYSASKFNAAFGTKTTDNLSEGLNRKYYSNALARAAFTVNSPLSYNSGTGVFSVSNIPNSSLTNSSITINGNLVSLGGSTTVSATTSISAPSTSNSITSGVAFQPRAGGPCNILVNTNVSGLVGVGSTVLITMSPASGGTYTTVASDAVSITILGLGDKASGLIPVPAGYWVRVTYTASGLATVTGTYTRWDL